MLITQKDRSFILLIISLIFIIYSLFSIPHDIEKHSASQNHKILFENSSWINVISTPKAKSLKSQLILLSFLDDVDNIEQIIDSRNIKDRFGRDISIITIFNDQNNAIIAEKSRKFDLNFPLIFDKNSKIHNHFEVRKKKFILLKPNGQIYRKYNSADFNKLIADILKLQKIHENKLKDENFKISNDQISPSYILSRPNSIKYIKKIKIQDYHDEAIIISNSGHNNIVITSLAGRIIAKIGSGNRGYKDGDFQNARFNLPQGLAIDDNIIYVADSGNNAIRKIDLNNKKVSTIIGSGQNKGSYLKGTIKAKKANLWLPWDLDIDNKDNILISNYGAGQILSYNIKNNNLTSLNQNSSNNKNSIKAKNISFYKNKLYFIDNNIIKYLDKNKNINNLTIDGNNISGNSFDINNNSLFIANDKDQSLRRINLQSKKSHQTKIEHKKSSNILKIDNNIYLSDQENDLILQINQNNTNIKIFDILPKLDVTADKIVKYLPNFNFTDEIFVKSNSAISVKMNLKKGWKLNDQAPSFVNLVEIDKNKNANLIKIYNWKDIEENKIKLPKLNKDFTYYIKAIIYYCKDVQNSICMVKEYHKKINVSQNIDNNKIIIDFIYQ